MLGWEPAVLQVIENQLSINWTVPNLCNPISGQVFISIPFTYYGPSFLWSVRVCNPSALGVHFLVNAARKTAISAENAAAFTLALLSEADFV